MIEPAQVAYEAYCKDADWKNFQGNPCPQWSELPEAVRQHWRAAVEAISPAGDA